MTEQRRLDGPGGSLRASFLRPTPEILTAGRLEMAALWILSLNSPVLAAEGLGASTNPNRSWLQALPDVLIGTACLAFLALLVCYAYRRRKIALPLLFWPFATLLAGNVLLHFVAAAADEGRGFRGMEFIKWGVALAAWVMVVRLVPLFPQALGLRNPDSVKREMAEQQRVEDALRASEERFRLLVESAKDFAMYMVGPEGHVTTWNDGAQRMKGYGSAEIIGRHISCFYTEEDQRQGKPAELLATAAGVGRAEDVGWHVRREGSRFWANSILTALRATDGKLRGYTHVIRDITHRKQLEEQLYQAQKMEAVGRLAGGVAHDFNNVLTIITGYGDLLLKRFPPEDSAHGLMREILMAGERAAGLTRQLLAFSRRQVLAPKILKLNAVIAETHKMLRRLIGEDIQLQMVTEPELGAVKADAGQIDQVLLNLAVNARDAMPQGGRLLIETKNVDLNEASAAAHDDLPPGPYVMLTVSDTGCGMDESTRAHLFEPFFTTKEVGKGTGLGLATVYGIIKQSGGHIEVETAVGKGTTFRIYLPRLSEAAAPAVGKIDASPSVPGSEVILLVEDEPALREMTAMVLRQQGYTVLEARDGSKAIRVAQQHRGPIDLVLTDMVMPLMNGFQLVQHLTAARPEMQVLYMSGYTDSAFVRGGVARGEVQLLQKPFSPDALTRKVRELLDQKASLMAGA
jgi:PAS domain S-box-containing protein